MRKYRFIVEMEDGTPYAVYAFSQKEAEILVGAYCIIKGLNRDIDVITGEKEGLATRNLAKKDDFEKEWLVAKQISLYNGN